MIVTNSTRRYLLGLIKSGQTGREMDRAISDFVLGGIDANQNWYIQYMYRQNAANKAEGEDAFIGPEFSRDFDVTSSVAERIAEHFTLFRFSTHFKAQIGTPDLYSDKGAKQVKMLPTADSPALALCKALLVYILKQSA